ncbi:hypothetical protein EBZ80_14420 [bacterium]|nr:hypothetical protein [bacterium]
MQMRVITFALVFLATPSCGTKNLGDCPATSPLVKCTALTTDEKIRRALNDEDLDTARTLLEDAIAAEPDNYGRYPLLSAVYAGLAGFKLLAILQQANSSGSSSITDAMDAFLPTPQGMSREEYDARIALLGDAIATINALPAEFLATASTDKYAASASQQLGIYQAAQASMYMKLFTYDFTTGSADPAQISQLTDQDAARIMSLLSAAATGGGPMAGIAASTLAAINAGGGTDRDNLANFLGS